MSQGIEFKYDHCVYGVTISNKEDLAQAIDVEKELQKDLKSKIKMYVSAGVSNIRNDNGEFVTIDELSYSLNDMFEDLENSVIKEYQLELAQDLISDGKTIGTDDSNDIMMITDTGTIIRISVKDVSVLGRSTQGVTLMRTNDGGKVVSIELVEPEDANEE